MHVTLHRNGYMFRADFIASDPPCVNLSRDGGLLGHCRWTDEGFAGLMFALTPDPDGSRDVVDALEAAISKALRAEVPR